MSLRRKLKVYGLFEGGVCLYVGHTSNAEQRKATHHKRFPNAEFRVLRECGNFTGLIVERQLIAEYRAKGEAQHNSERPKFPKTVTVRISTRVHRLAKAHTQSTGMLLEKWVERVIECELLERGLVLPPEKT